MTLPIEPTAAAEIPPTPEPVGVAAPAQEDIRALAAALTAPQLAFDPTTIRKAVVTAIDAGGATTPPTVSVYLSGDTSATVAGVRLSNDYSPVIGDTVIVLKQGAEFFVLTSIAAEGSKVISSTTGGWLTASLATGLNHDGNGNGFVMYRRVLEDGCWKMQWKGACSISGTQTIVLAAALPSTYTPSSKQSVLAARDPGGGSVAVGLDFRTDGQIYLVGPTTVPFVAVSEAVSVNAVGSLGGDIGSVGSHSHAYTHPTQGTIQTGTNGGHDHSVSINGHSHSANISVNVTPSVNHPDWVSFASVEYFL